MNSKYLDPDGVYRLPDKREVCDLKSAKGKREYYNRTRELSARQDEICPLCKQFMISPTFDHQEGRGMAGSFRQDALLDAEGKWINAALCWPCNLAKGSRRFHWVNGEYLEQA